MDAQGRSWAELWQVVRAAPRSRPAHRVPTGDDIIDERRHGPVRGDTVVRGIDILVGGGGISQNADNLVFRQDMGVVQGQQQCFANCQRRDAGMCVIV